VFHRLDEFNPLGGVNFSFDFSHELTEYLGQQVPVSTCGSGELLVNGLFEAPPHTDATRRVFGQVPPGESRSLTGTVTLLRGGDLIVELYITLATEAAPSVIINCAGPMPSQKQLNDIVTAINRYQNQTKVEATASRAFVQLNGQTNITLDPWCRQQV